MVDNGAGGCISGGHDKGRITGRLVVPKVERAARIGGRCNGRSAPQEEKGAGLSSPRPFFYKRLSMPTAVLVTYSKDFPDCSWYSLNVSEFSGLTSIPGNPALLHSFSML